MGLTRLVIDSDPFRRVSACIEVYRFMYRVGLGVSIGETAYWTQPRVQKSNEEPTEVSTSFLTQGVVAGSTVLLLPKRLQIFNPTEATEPKISTPVLTQSSIP